MAHTVISVTNGVEIKKVPLGFSWTTFIFGGWVPLIRQDWIWGFCLLLACIFTWGLAGVVAAFFYNKIYAKSLFAQGFKIHAMPPEYTEDMVKADLGYLKFPNEA